MPTKEEDFKERFAAIVADMRDAAVNPDEMQMLGSLAQRIISHAGQPDWVRFKATLSATAYSSLLTTFQNQGNELARQGAMRQMRAIEVLACSLVARTQTHDPELVKEDRVLDILIDRAIRLQRGAAPADPIIS